MNNIIGFIEVFDRSLESTLLIQSKELQKYIQTSNEVLLILIITFLYSAGFYIFLYIMPYVIWLLAMVLTIKNYEEMPNWATFFSFILILTYYGSPCFPIGIVYIGKNLYRPPNITWYKYLGTKFS